MFVCCFFLGRPCDFFPNKTLSCISVACLLIELFYIGMSAVRTDSREVGRSVDGHVITTFSYQWCSAALASRARAPLNRADTQRQRLYASMICPFCNSGEIENEKYVFFSLNLLSNIRLHLRFRGVFQFTQVQPLPSPYKQCWTRVSRIFSKFQLCIGWGEEEPQENFEKDSLF